MCRKVIGNMTFWVTNTYELAPFLDVSYYISKQLGNLSRIMPVPMYFLLEMTCLQLHFLFMTLQETSLLSLCLLQLLSNLPTLTSPQYRFFNFVQPPFFNFFPPSLQLLSNLFFTLFQPLFFNLPSSTTLNLHSL